MIDDYTFENGEVPTKPAQPVEPWVPEERQTPQLLKEDCEEK
jgi:hypothetical protein